MLSPISGVVISCVRSCLIFKFCVANVSSCTTYGSRELACFCNRWGNKCLENAKNIRNYIYLLLYVFMFGPFQVHCLYCTSITHTQIQNLIIISNFVDKRISIYICVENLLSTTFRTFTPLAHLTLNADTHNHFAAKIYLCKVQSLHGTFDIICNTTFWFVCRRPAKHFDYNSKRDNAEI